MTPMAVLPSPGATPYLVTIHQRLATFNTTAAQIVHHWNAKSATSNKRLLHCNSSVAAASKK